jgi:hypothetical protein
VSDKEFRRHIAQVLAQQRKEDQQPVEKRPPASEKSKPAAVTKKEPPVAEVGQFKVRKKAK